MFTKNAKLGIKDNYYLSEGTTLERLGVGCGADYNDILWAKVAFCGVPQEQKSICSFDTKLSKASKLTV